jgi:hypothetical protein
MDADFYQRVVSLMLIRFCSSSPTHPIPFLAIVPAMPYQVVAALHVHFARTSFMIAGGGAALLHLSELLPSFRETEEEEERLGCDIVMKALRAPCRIIADNAGVEGEVVVQRLLNTHFEQVCAQVVMVVLGLLAEKGVGLARR